MLTYLNYAMTISTITLGMSIVSLQKSFTGVLCTCYVYNIIIPRVG